MAPGGRPAHAHNTGTQVHTRHSPPARGKGRPCLPRQRAPHRLAQHAALLGSGGAQGVPLGVVVVVVVVMVVPLLPLRAAYVLSACRLLDAWRVTHVTLAAAPQAAGGLAGWRRCEVRER
ncbi:hypothetical protein E2C01_086611 [Portunus trituberculatus]|uniref:Uncharacterized protein n=1 Tax=Portunus trituberculatus TaxID=210409 RepID=A0A5B7JBX9_PORTR|nr:hypothetical protein [Portunus trituberculatus]